MSPAHGRFGLRAWRVDTLPPRAPPPPAPPLSQPGLVPLNDDAPRTRARDGGTFRRLDWSRRDATTDSPKTRLA